MQQLNRGINMYSIDEHKSGLINAIASWVENQELCRKEEGNDSPITLLDIKNAFDIHDLEDKGGYYKEFLESYIWAFQDNDFESCEKQHDQNIFISLLENLTFNDVADISGVESVQNVISEKLSKINDYIENSYLNDREFEDGEDLKRFDAQFDRSSKIHNLIEEIACAVLDNDQASVQVFKNKLIDLL
tara:strand:+ start:112 stop:678 length:567 start_codon:yes stop_codon:yes gene_type:complete